MVKVGLLAAFIIGKITLVDADPSLSVAEIFTVVVVIVDVVGVPDITPATTDKPEGSPVTL